MNDHISKCALPGLRAAAGFVVALGLAGTALGQNTALTINGQTAANNSTSLNAAVGTTMTIKIDNTAQPNRPYGLFVALANTGAASGWYLAATGGGKKPMPVTTGVATAVVEANYSTDISPDRPFNPNVHLDAGGHLVISFLVPNSVVGQTYYFQSVILKSGSFTATDLSNAVAVTFSSPTTAARIACSVATAGSPQSDHAGFGILEFTNGNPTSGVFTADPVLVDIKVDNIAMGDIQPWGLHATNGANNARRPRDFNWQSGGLPAFNPDNWDYARVELPPLPGADGIMGTSDDIPARSVMRCFDNVTSEGFFMIVNKGPNPNSPGVDFYTTGRKKDSSPAVPNSWRVTVTFSPDGSRMSAIYDDSNVSILPQMFLIATDCSKPFTDGLGNPTDIIEVTPNGSKNFFIRGQIFTNNRFWFTRDAGNNADGGSLPIDEDRELWTVNIRAAQPVAQQVAIPTNPNYTNPFVDQIPDKAFVVGRNGGTTLCFVAGNTFTGGTNSVPDNVLGADWYCVTEAKPTAAVNITQFPTFAGGAMPTVYVAGDAYNGQSGYASLSPDGSELAITVQHANEGIAGTEEVYIYSTKDTNGDGVGDDAGSVKFNNPISSSANFLHSAVKRADDLYLADNNHLFFFYGAWATTAVPREMDLFAWDNSAKVLTPLTATTGATTLPINKKGNLYPEGYFPSPNGRYMIFSRGHSALSKTNLVAVDTTTSKLINITGDEFPGAKTSITTNPGAFGENFDFHLSYAGGLYPSLCYFAAPIDQSTGLPRNPWVFDANFPTTAIQLTNDTTSGQYIEGLTPSSVSLGCAWYWCVNNNVSCDLQYQDLLYYFRDDLTETGRTGSVPLGQINFLRPGNSSDTTGASPPALIAGFGDDAVNADNPHDGKFYYFSLNGTTNYKASSTVGPDAPGHQIGSSTGVIQIYAVTKP